MSSKFLVKEVLPRLPFMLRLALAHSLGLLETSSKWDLKGTLIIRFIRALLAKQPPATISAQQAFSLRDPGIAGQMWVAKITVPAPPETDCLRKLVGAIDALGGKEGGSYEVPDVGPVQAEWTGFRRGVDGKAKHLAHLSEEELYGRMMGDTTSEVTVLYIHGGALYLMDPASHRPVCSRLGKIMGGRCLSVRYRLAPKYPFPAALLDCLIAYLCLLSPPAGSYHKPVPASKIVFAGDSAGGNLSFALLQFILHLHRAQPSGQTPTIRFHGQDVPLPVPAGVAASSAWLDLTRSMPSLFNNAKWDYIPPPTESSMVDRFGTCALWPTKPRREDIYCETAILMHPFASPLAVKSSDWEGSCPVFLLYGQELLTDEGAIVCRKLSRANVPVQWEEYEAMPHCWPMVLQGAECSHKAFNAWGDFIARVCKGEQIETKGTFHEAKTLRERDVNVRELGELTDAQVEERMRAEVRKKEAYGAKGKEDQVLAKL